MAPTPARRSRPRLIGCAAVAAAAVPLYALAAARREPGARSARRSGRAHRRRLRSTLDTEGGTGPNRLLVRFDGFVTNVGERTPRDPGRPPARPVGRRRRQAVRARDRAAPRAPSPTEAVATPEVTFEIDDSHDHFHLMRAMRYSLWNLGEDRRGRPGPEGRLLPLRPRRRSRAAGARARRLRSTSRRVTHFCDSGDPDRPTCAWASPPDGGTSTTKSLAFQWVDVSSTAPGTYLVGEPGRPRRDRSGRAAATARRRTRARSPPPR